jgi:threonyl-tRNA synthetase
MRARRFTQDDAHIFCTEDQLQDEVATLIDMVFETYRDFGFTDIALALSLRPDKRVGSDALWDKGEAALDKALRDKGLEFRIQPGEGAFYGPKIEFTLHDSIGRAWQCGTIQADFSMPGRLGSHYIAEDNSKQTPVMIHRAILGSIERFIGILIEHYAGALPAWLAPVQVVVCNITDRQAPYVREVANALRMKGFRAEFDLRNEKIGFKIREHTLQRVPYLLVLGDREVESRTLAVRDRRGQDLGVMGIEDFIARLGQEVEARAN